jgi:hypothetical protein
MNIIVNAKECFVSSPRISYDWVVHLAGMSGRPTVTYYGRRTGDSQRSGTMYPGCLSLDLEDGMVFNVAHTGNA